VSVVNHCDVVISIGNRLIEQGDSVIALYFYLKLAFLYLKDVK